MITTDTLLHNGDFVRNPFGHPVTLNGYNELLQQILIRLSIKKGSFELDKELGSNIYRLKSANSTILNNEALIYAREALMAMENIQVISADVEMLNTDSAIVTVRVKLDDATADVSFEVADI